MTSSINDQWSWYDLMRAKFLIEEKIWELHEEQVLLNSAKRDRQSLTHAINFIMHNIRKMDISSSS